MHPAPLSLPVNASEPKSGAKPPAPHFFPIRTQLDYRLIRGGALVSGGTGCSVYLGSKSVQFEADSLIPLNLLVELSIRWPVQLENRIDLKLQMTGRTIQVSGNRVTLEVLKHEFRLRGAGQTMAAAG